MLILQNIYERQNISFFNDEGLRRSDRVRSAHIQEKTAMVDIEKSITLCKWWWPVCVMRTTYGRRTKKHGGRKPEIETLGGIESGLCRVVVK